MLGYASNKRADTSLLSAYQIEDRKVNRHGNVSRSEATPRAVEINLDMTTALGRDMIDTMHTLGEGGGGQGKAADVAHSDGAILCV